MDRLRENPTNDQLCRLPWERNIVA